MKQHKYWILAGSIFTFIAILVLSVFAIRVLKPAQDSQNPSESMVETLTTIPTTSPTITEVVVDGDTEYIKDSIEFKLPHSRYNRREYKMVVDLNREQNSEVRINYPENRDYASSVNIIGENYEFTVFSITPDSGPDHFKHVPDFEAIESKVENHNFSSDKFYRVEEIKKAMDHKIYSYIDYFYIVDSLNEEEQKKFCPSSIFDTDIKACRSHGIGFRTDDGNYRSVIVQCEVKKGDMSIVEICDNMVRSMNINIQEIN